MKKCCSAVWAVVVSMLVLGLTAGCEEPRDDDEADFTYQSDIPMDYYSYDTRVNISDTYDVNTDGNPDMNMDDSADQNTDDSPDMNDDARRGSGHRSLRSLRH